VPDGSGVSDPADTPPDKINPAMPVELIAGVTAQNLTPALAKRYEIAKDVEGVVVTKVAPDSSAAAVGLTEGDVIQGINRVPVKNLDEARPLLKDAKETIFLKVHRKGASMLFIVRD
jgi:serine protease Do